MKPNDINPYSLASAIDAAIGKAFVNTENQTELDNLKSLFGLVDDLGYKIHIIVELKKLEYLKFNKYTREKPAPWMDSQPIEPNTLKTQTEANIEQLRVLKIQSVKEQNFESAASYRDKENLLRSIGPLTPMQEVIDLLNNVNNIVYPTTIKTHVRIIENVIDIYIISRNRDFGKKIESLLPILDKGWLAKMKDFFLKRKK
jgi:hypothetical protein